MVGFKYQEDYFSGRVCAVMIRCSGGCCKITKLRDKDGKMVFHLTTDKEESSARSRLIRRKGKRTEVKGFIGDIADGNYVFSSIVSDISSAGVRLSNLPMDFTSEGVTYRTIISGNGKNYKVVIRPCWIKKDPRTKTQEGGFQIIDSPWDWEEFIHSLLDSDSTGPGGMFTA